MPCHAISDSNALFHQLKPWATFHEGFRTKKKSGAKILVQDQVLVFLKVLSDELGVLHAHTHTGPNVWACVGICLVTIGEVEIYGRLLVGEGFNAWRLAIFSYD